ncbi:MAG: hypothetical protein ACK4RK_12180 [Gemmataceae bacterium]
MKVIQQLIEHFWQRGALTLVEAHYLVEHGFVLPEDLDGYVPPPLEPDVPERPPVEVLWPGPMELRQEALEEQNPPQRKKKRKTGVKLPEYDLKTLCAELGAIFQERAVPLQALTHWGNRLGGCATWEEAAVLLRHADEAICRRELAQLLRRQPGLLLDLWEGVDTERVHALLVREGARGPVARGLRYLLRVNDAAHLGALAWILQGEELQALANLLHARRRLLAAIAALYGEQFPLLSRGFRQPPAAGSAAAVLAWGLILLYNARAHRQGRFPPTGYRLEKRPLFAAWRQAWTAALSLDSPCMTRYFVLHYGGMRDLQEQEAWDRPWDEGVFCPDGWKV